MTKSHDLISNTSNYPRNCWWVAGFTDEIREKPVDRWILDRPVLLYRKLNGAAVALDNRCPHRSAPLSLGRVIGDNIECPYHGMTFGPEGKCVRIPSQKTVRDDCNVHCYPVIESGPFVWIWMGDPSRISEYDPPTDLEWAVNDTWSCTYDQMEMSGNYMQLHDNVMDLTHFNFIHRESLLIDDWIHPPKVTTGKTTVSFRQEFKDRRMPTVHAAVTNSPPERLASRFSTEGNWITPAIHLAREVIEFDEVEPGNRHTFTMRIAHVTTPLNMTSYRYFFIVGWDVKFPEEFRNSMKAGVNAIFNEDKRVLEATHELLQHDIRGRAFPEVHLAADTPQLHARKKLADWLARE